LRAAKRSTTSKDCFYTNIKPDSNANYGKKAAFCDGRVYYLSAENGTQGIYSMNADGSDVRIEKPRRISARWR
jgi:tricorn protease-like protein